MNRCRERWVHQHDTRHDAGIEVVVDVRGVKPGRGDGGKKLREDAGTALGKFVENERGAGEFSEDGKKAGAGRRLQNDVGGGDRGSDAGDVCQSNRRGELLKGFTFLGPPCLCRKEARNPQQHRQHGGRRRRLGAHGGAIPSQEQDGRRLAGVIGRLPVPGAGRIGGGKRCLHGIAQNSGVDAPTPFKIGQKLSRSLNDGRSDNCGGTDRERHGGAVDERFGHGRDFSESGTGPSRPALS